jgi:hypothetical protein
MPRYSKTVSHSAINQVEWFTIISRSAQRSSDSRACFVFYLIMRGTNSSVIGKGGSSNAACRFFGKWPKVVLTDAAVADVVFGPLVANASPFQWVDL